TEKQLADNRRRWEETSAEWNAKIPPLWDTLRRSAEAGAAFPPWQRELWQNWRPPDSLADGIPFGHAAVRLGEFCDGLPQSDRLPLPGPSDLDLPLMLAFPNEGSLFIESARNCSGAIADGLNGLILRMLSQSPPGR